jgi:O-antigen/teichoic acid export membrane protein
MISGDTAAKAIRNMFFSGARLLITMGASMATSAIIARNLGPANVGLYSYTIWIVGTLGTLANIGIPAALTKYVSEYLGKDEVGTAVQVAKRLLLTQLMVASGVAAATACFMFFKTPYRSIVGLAAVMLFAQALQQSLGSALIGVQRFDRLALIGLYVALASVTSVAVAALLHAGVLGMLWATLGGLAVGIWLYYRAVAKFLLKLSSSVELLPRAPDVFGRIRTFSATVSYVLLLDTIVWQRSEVLFLKWYSTLAQIGFYTLAYSVVSKLSDVASTFSNILLPLYSESYGRSGLREIRSVLVSALKYLQILMVPLCLMSAVIATPLVELMYGREFLPVVRPLQLLFVGLSFTSVGVVISPLLLGTENQSVIAKWGTAVAVLNIALDLVLIPKYAALGASIANCTAQIAGVLGGVIYVVRYMRVTIPWKSTSRIYSAAFVAVASTAYLVRQPNLGRASLLGCVLVGALLYLCLLLVTGELGRRDFIALKQALMTKAHGSVLDTSDSTLLPSDPGLNGPECLSDNVV